MEKSGSAAPCTGCSAMQCPGISACPGCRPYCPLRLTAEEQSLLSELSSVLYLPLAQFILVPKGGDWEEGKLILSPVLLEKEDDTLEAVAARADVLVSLARKRLLTLDFGIPLENYSYGIYYRSDLFREFSSRFRNAPEGRPLLRQGSMAVTEPGLAAAAGSGSPAAGGPAASSDAGRKKEA